MNDAFISCEWDSRLRAGHQLSTSITAVTTSTGTTYRIGVAVLCAASGCSRSRKLSGSTENASTIAAQLSQEKLPLATSQSWVTIMIPAATPETGCGANRPNGTTSWVTWFAATSTLCSGLGRWWNHQLSGPGIGWVSWW